jgi:hypothetical protein
MKVLQVHAKTSEVCVIPADSAKANPGLWVKLTDIEVPGLRAVNTENLLGGYIE